MFPEVQAPAGRVLLPHECETRADRRSDTERPGVDNGAARGFSVGVQSKRHYGLVRHVEAGRDSKLGGRGETEARVVLGVAQDQDEVSPMARATSRADLL